MVRTGFRCRAYPTPVQQSVFSRAFGCVRKVRNLTLAWRQARWRDTRTNTGYGDANASLTPRHLARKARNLARYQRRLGLRAPARQTRPFDPGMDVSGVRHPARQGSERREEHPGGRSCRDSLRS